MGSVLRVGIAMAAVAVLLAACGEEAADSPVVEVPPDPFADEQGQGVEPVQGRFSADQVLDAYSKRIGVPLRIDDRVKGSYVTLTTLPGPPYAPIAPDLGLFSIYVATSQREAEALIGNPGQAEEQVQREPGVRFVAGDALVSAKSRFANVVLDWNADDLDQTDERFQRLAYPLESLGGKAAAQPGLEPCAPGPVKSGADGGETCRLGPQVITFTPRDSTLDFGGVTVRLTGAAADDPDEPETYEVLPHQREDLSVGPDPPAEPQDIRPKGTFYVVRLEIENGGEEPLEDLEAGLVVGERLLNRNLDDTFYVDETNPPFPLEPGESGELLLLFDLPPRFVPDGQKEAWLVLIDPRNRTSLSTPGSAPTVARLRLFD